MNKIRTIPTLIAVAALSFLMVACGGGGSNDNPGGGGGGSAKAIHTFAGTGDYGYTGDGGPAKSARLSAPYGVSVDANGNVYIADTGNSVIRKVDTSGKITTIAGNGMQGFSGDGGLATSASLYAPTRAVPDRSGNLYIADYYNQRIRKVDPAGIIATFAGTGDFGYNGDGILATSAQLNSPYGIAVDSVGNVYIADSFNYRIRKVDTSGMITTIAGDGWGGAIGDGGPATSAELSEPEDVALDGHGNIYIADAANSKIRKIDSSGIITTLAGNGNFDFGGDGGPAASAVVNFPTGVTADSSGNVYIADFQNNRIRKVDSSGTITTIAGTGTSGFSGDGGPPASAELSFSMEVAVDTAGNVYIADTNNARIREIH